MDNRLSDTHLFEVSHKYIYVIIQLNFKFKYLKRIYNES